MKIVVITAPEFLQGEAGAVAALLDAGVWRIHVRKPGAGASEMSALLDEIPERCRSSISLHDCHELAVRYGLGGVHLNGRNPRPPHGFSGLVSRSCHSFSELSEYASICDYMFLSPVFDSISKQGYRSHFSIEDIRANACAGAVNDRVFALGGVSPENIRQVSEAGFGGAAVLGYLWEPFRRDCDVPALVGRFHNL